MGMTFFVIFLCSAVSFVAGGVLMWLAMHQPGERMPSALAGGNSGVASRARVLARASRAMRASLARRREPVPAGPPPLPPVEPVESAEISMSSVESEKNSTQVQHTGPMSATRESETTTVMPVIGRSQRQPANDSTEETAVLRAQEAPSSPLEREDQHQIEADPPTGPIVLPPSPVVAESAEPVTPEEPQEYEGEPPTTPIQLPQQPDSDAFRQQYLEEFAARRREFQESRNQSAAG
ncbi:hypothetical protein D5S17_33435 [Pseudonocardiaceae bacterium YIM PH 21723]|nr:hypothetical protein D5S17_33435 [Pseudonocardiaceae bacterium YIM PH 21723]